jgi:hypothetical protein
VSLSGCLFRAIPGLLCLLERLPELQNPLHNEVYVYWIQLVMGEQEEGQEQLQKLLSV